MNAIDDLSRELSDPCRSFWFADALRAALDRDPVDAATDALLLSKLLTARCDYLLAQEGR